MPGYEWVCHVCGAIVAASEERCPSCGTAAQISAEELEKRSREKAGLPPPRAWNPRVAGGIFLGAYAALVGITVLFMATAGGDMTGLLIVLPALPWPALGMKLIGPDLGLGAGTVAGLVFNAVIAFYTGAAIARRRNRRLRSLSGPARS